MGCAAEAPPLIKAPAKAAAAKGKAVAAASEMAEGAPREELPWATFSPETFARAKAQHKYIVLDGSAEWCHWCYVMEATTYHDPEIRKILERHFIAVKVDVDSRPDVEERYGEWGWPATVMFAPDATEIGKYRGYIDPEKFKGILDEIVASGIADRRGDEPVRAAVAGSTNTRRHHPRPGRSGGEGQAAVTSRTTRRLASVSCAPTRRRVTPSISRRRAPSPTS